LLLGVEVVRKSPDRTDRFPQNADPHGELVLRPLERLVDVTRVVCPPKAKSEGWEGQAPRAALLAIRESSLREGSAFAHLLAVPFPACASVAPRSGAPAWRVARR